MLHNGERGFVLVTVLIVLAVAMLSLGLSLDNSSNTFKSSAITKIHSIEYYEVENSIAKTISWLQKNSLYFVKTFNDPVFSTKFELTAIPVKGDNDDSPTNTAVNYFRIPTKIKVKNSSGVTTGDSAIISNNSDFGVSNFPVLTHRDTGASWDPIHNFANADTGNTDGKPGIDVNVRITAVYAEKSGSDYAPVFRIDAITGNNPDRGVHSYSYVTSRIEEDASGSASGGTPTGFYGHSPINLSSVNNSCVSHAWTRSGATWSAGIAKSNCLILSTGNVTTNGTISGSAYTKQTGGILNPAKISGVKCSGTTCHNIVFPGTALQTYDSYCPGITRDISLTGNSSQTITYTSGSSQASRCWRNISLGGRSTLTIQNTAGNAGDPPLPFYFKSLDVGGTANVIMMPYGPADAAMATKLNNGTIDPARKVTIYIENFGSQNKINGNTFVNTNYPPSLSQINYYGSNNFTYQGTANIRTGLYAPYASVHLTGNATWFGCIQAQAISGQGNAKLDYDESCGTTMPATSKNLIFGMSKISHRYR